MQLVSAIVVPALFFHYSLASSGIAKNSGQPCRKPPGEIFSICFTAFKHIHYMGIKLALLHVV